MNTSSFFCRRLRFYLQVCIRYLMQNIPFFIGWFFFLAPVFFSLHLLSSTLLQANFERTTCTVHCCKWIRRCTARKEKKKEKRRTLKILYSLRCIRVSLFRTKREHFLCGFNHLLHSSKLLNHVMIILLRATKIFFFLFCPAFSSTLCVCLLFFVSTFYILFWTVSMFTRLISLMMKRKRRRGWWW